MDDEGIFSEFLEESFKQIHDFENKLLNFEHESQKLLLIQSLYRDIHTLKGNVGFFNFPNLENTLHKSENIFNFLQKKQEDDLNQFSKEQKNINLLFEISDHIKDSLKYIEKNKIDIHSENFELSNKIEFLCSDLNSTKKIVDNSKNQRKKKLSSIQIKALEKLKGSNNSEMNRNIEPRKLTEKSLTNDDEIDDRAELDESMIVKITSLDKLSSLSSELIMVRNQLKLIIDEDHDTNNNLYTLYHKFDFLIQNISERITTIRMQPLSIITDKLKRSVRELAKNCNKEIKFITKGEKIELDRIILDSLKDTLVHLFRNAIDHGIETPEERESLNKDRIGKIKIKASYLDNHVILKVSDDGKGIDINKIKEKALQNNLITEERLATLSREELLNFIFHPNFSTKEIVSKISGRGIGMNIVQESLKKINGSIQIETETGIGTTFIIKLPLTLAYGSAVIVEIEKIKYAIPSNYVKELLSINKNKLINKKSIEIREVIYEIVFARNFLYENISIHEEYYLNQEDLDCILVEINEFKYIFVVDSITDLQDIIIRPIPKGLDHLNHYSGTTILPEGNVALILNMEKISNEQEISIPSSEETCSLESQTLNLANTDNINYLCYKLGNLLLGIDRDLVRETVYQKKITLIPRNEIKSLMNLRNEIILNKKLGPLLNIHNDSETTTANIILEMQKQIFSIEVDDVEDFITINNDDLILKEPDESLKGYLKQAYLLKNGTPLYILKDNLYLKSN